MKIVNSLNNRVISEHSDLNSALRALRILRMEDPSGFYPAKLIDLHGIPQNEMAVQQFNTKTCIEDERTFQAVLLSGPARRRLVDFGEPLIRAVASSDFTTVFFGYWHEIEDLMDYNVDDRLMPFLDETGNWVVVRNEESGEVPIKDFQGKTIRFASKDMAELYLPKHWELFGSSELGIRIKPRPQFQRFLEFCTS